MLLHGGMILISGSLVARDIRIDDNGIIIEIGENLAPVYPETIYDVTDMWVNIGACDMHGHLREPGFEHKETIATGTQSAAKGGITAVAAMPNLRPTPDSIAHLQTELEIIHDTAVVDVYPIGAITVGQQGKVLSAMSEMAPYVAAFSDDGVGVENTALLEQAMQTARSLGKPILSHAEALGLGTTPEAEYVAVRREAALAERTGVKYHFCHLSTEQSWQAVRESVQRGADITAEVTPHHLLLTEDDIEGTNWKMNPPLRSERDRQATVDALLSGVAGMVATDHAPHTAEEKAADYAHAPNGIIGFETLLPLLYTEFVLTGKMSIADMVDVTCINPRRRLGIDVPRICVGDTANIAVLDILHAHTYTAQEIMSKSSNSPFVGRRLFGMNHLTVIGNRVAYCHTNINRYFI